MVVVGADVHKRTHTFVAVDEVGRKLGEKVVSATTAGHQDAEAMTTRVDGAKTFAAGHLADDQGVTVGAEGVFILPRWARGDAD